MLAGDGDGIVDAAAAGLIDGNQLVLQPADLTDAELASALRRQADLVVTDSNRRRAENWFTSIRDNKGATERAGQTLPDPTGLDFRLDVFPGPATTRGTVVEQDGGTVDATARRRHRPPRGPRRARLRRRPRGPPGASAVPTPPAPSSCS